MSHTLTVDMLGAAIGIDLSGLDPVTRRRAHDAWADALAPVGVSPETTVAPDPRLDGPRALEQLSQLVTLAGITAHRGTMWMLHAAGVADADGRVLVFVGPSGRGKTTASIALGREFSYVSDETIGIMADGTVRAYRKPLSIIEQPGGKPKVQRAPSSLGLRRLPEAPLTLGGIVLLDRREDGPEEPEVQPVSLVDAIEDLVPQSSSLVAMDAPLQFMAARVGETGGLTRITYREAAMLPGVVAELLARRNDPIDVVTRALASFSASTAADPGMVRYVRADTVDAIEEVGRDVIVVLQRGLDDGGHIGVVRVLTGIAPVLWRSAAGATVHEFVQAAVEAYGLPEPGRAEPEPLVRKALSDLTATGVLRVE
ncbi:hypothetical protein [Microbacterium sp.]|uniref:hypothetical protein n=1 Tax=Microbacterium sp. TaxID=51671 RepID=UPI003C7764BD